MAFSLFVNSNLTSDSVWVQLNNPIKGFTPLLLDINSNTQLLLFPKPDCMDVLAGL